MAPWYSWGSLALCDLMKRNKDGDLSLANLKQKNTYVKNKKRNKEKNEKKGVEVDTSEVGKVLGRGS